MQIKLRLGAALVPERRLYGLGLAVLTSLAGCASMTVPESELVSNRGAYATVVHRVGPWIRVSNISLIPGNQKTDRFRSAYTGCRNTHIRIEITGTVPDLPAPQLSSLCHDILDGLAFISSKLASQAPYYVLRVKIVPPNSAVRSVQTNWATRRRVTSEFTFPWNQDVRFAHANIVSTTAHESFHLLGLFTGLPEPTRTNEQLAYLLGACSQMASLGYVRIQDFPKLDLDTASAGVSPEMISSSAAGSSLREELGQFFGAEQEITLPSTGQAFLSFCHRMPL